MAEFSRIGASRAAAQRERLIVLGGGTLLLSLVLIGALILLRQNTVQAGSPVSPQLGLSDGDVLTTVVLVAPVEDIGPGIKIGPDSLKEISWPRDNVPEGAIRDAGELANMYSKVKLIANTPILRTSIQNSPPTVGIAELLPPGTRAVTLEVDATQGLEGWATPGAHVDVSLTYVDQADRQTKSRIVVEDAVVLSLGGSTKSPQGTDPDAITVKPSSTVTLAVASGDMLKVQTARAMGRIFLALRSPNDVGSGGPQIFSETEWDKSPKKQEPNKFVPRGFAVYKGTDGQQKEFVLNKDNKWFKSEDDPN